MKKNIEPCANCDAEIYRGGDGEHFHLKTGNKWCAWGVFTFRDELAGKVATPKAKAAA